MNYNRLPVWIGTLGLLGILSLLVGGIASFFYGLTYPWTVPLWASILTLLGGISLAVAGILIIVWLCSCFPRF